MPESQQSFANHTKWDPKYHFFLSPLLTVHLIYRIYDLFTGELTVDAIWDAVVAFGLVVMAFVIRLYSLKVQDRLIRLEERLRLQTLLPANQHARIADLTIGQIVALRFASDAELPDLFEKTLKDNLNSKQIKQAIKNWRADHFRV